MKTLVEKLIDILIYIVIIIGMVISYYGQKQDTLTQQLVSTEASDFINTVQTQGVITKNLYESFLARMNTTDMIYDIKLEHKSLAIEPEYRFRSADEIIEDQNGSYTGDNIYHYYPVSTEIPIVNEPSNDDLTMNTETNESVLATAINTGPAVGHIHTDDCYNGHRHSDSGNNYFIHNHKHYACTEYTKAMYAFVNCTNCNQYYNALAAYWHWYNGPVFDGNYNTYNCPNCNATGQKNTVYFYDYGYSCGYDKDLNGDGFGDKVGYTTTYEYRSTIPQTTDWGIYTPGCYSYHQAKYISDYYIYYEGSYTISASSVRTALSQLTIRNFTGFCKIPKYIAIGLSERDFQSSPYYNPQEWPNITSVRYETFIDTNGSIKFRFNSYWETGSWGGNTYYNNPGFPAILTVDQFKSYSYSSPINSLFKTATGKDYNYSRNGNIEAHIQYFVGTNRVDSTEYLNVCTFNHSLGLNKWVPTCGKEGNGVLACDKKVTGITPTHPIQSVYTNEPLITTVTATYQDGSTKIVLGTSSFLTNNPITNHTVTLTYTDTLSKTHTCTIKVNVIPRNRACVNGHTYNLNNDGTDPGCPYCKAWLRSLEVVDPATGHLTIYRGTTLHENGVLLMATYLNGRKELLDTGYVNNLDKNYMGSQTVTISYKGKNTTLNVTVKRNIVQCPDCERYYELFPDDTDPGCPYCASRVPILTGKVMKYYGETFSGDILKEIYEGSGVYTFNPEDYISISITNRVETLGTKVLRLFFHSAPKVTLRVEQGGKVRNKAVVEGENKY